LTYKVYPAPFLQHDCFQKFVACRKSIRALADIVKNFAFGCRILFLYLNSLSISSFRVQFKRSTFVSLFW